MVSHILLTGVLNKELGSVIVTLSIVVRKSYFSKEVWLLNILESARFLTYAITLKICSDIGLV